MSDALFMNAKRVVREGYAAYGPWAVILTLGGCAGLLPPLLYRIAFRVLATSVESEFGTLIPAHNPQPWPLYLFACIGVLYAVLSRLCRRLWPFFQRWPVPWEAGVGVPMYTGITWSMFQPMLHDGASLFQMVCMMLCGTVVYGLWSGAYWLAIQILASLSWRETAIAVVYHFSRCIGIPRARIFLVQADHPQYTVCVRGSFSEVESSRLQAGLLMALDYVTDLRVYGSRTALRTQPIEVAAYAAIAKARREAAIARLGLRGRR